MSKTRAVTVVRPFSPGPGVVRVDGRGRRVYYLIYERDTDPGPPPGRVFVVCRLGAAESYTARTGAAPSCECVGWYAHGRCVHTGLLSALARSKKI